jgi:hypothetical protein
MEISGDELAGVVDLFGGMTREELGEALAELAFKHGEEYDPDAFSDVIDEAIVEYYLLALEPDDVEADVDAPVLVAGPAAFPELPENARDLTHILDVETREIDRERAGLRAAEQFRTDAAQVVAAGETEQIGHLLDVSYELEAWGPIDLSDVRKRLDDSR